MTAIAKIFKVLLALAVGIVMWLALSPNPPSAAGLFDFDKLNHVAAFVVLATLMDYAFPNVNSIALKMLAVLGFGVLVEVLQYFVGYRYAELMDVVADLGGLVLYVLLRRPLRAFADPIIKSALVK